MVKITNKIDGKRYEFVTGTNDCTKCAFYNGSCDCSDEQSNFGDYVLCVILCGIWKEVKK